MLYSATTGGFYDPVIHATVPNDAVEIGDDVYLALLDAQAQGKIITADADGHPIAAAPPPPTQDEWLARLRAERDARLSASDVMVLPDRWEGYSPAQRAAWAAYRQALRDLPEATLDPAAPDWPTPPDAQVPA